MVEVPYGWIVGVLCWLAFQQRTCRLVGFRVSSLALACYPSAYVLFVRAVEEETHEEAEAQAPQDEAEIQVGDVRPCKRVADHLA
jgi:hypothetical protein